MRHVVRKAFWDYEKEERWLNEMAARGLALVDYSWCRYVFEESEAGEYRFRIEMLEYWPGNPRSREYFRFMEENGVEHIASYMAWAYFRRPAAAGAFDIYSDTASRIRHYGRVAVWWLALAAVELLLALVAFSEGFTRFLPGVQAAFSGAGFVAGCVVAAFGAGFLLLAVRYWRKGGSFEAGAGIAGVMVGFGATPVEARRAGLWKPAGGEALRTFCGQKVPKILGTIAMVPNLRTLKGGATYNLYNSTNCHV